MIFSFNMAASLSSNFYGKAPIIIVLGATGTGKSKLAVEIALKFKGEVINADSMQVYRGLNIATNKMTEEEQMGIRHHLLGFLDPPKKLMVPEFRNLALGVIEDVVKREKLPIIVGGTNYYIESVLYNVLIDTADWNTENSTGNDSQNENRPLAKRTKFDEEEKNDLFWSSIEGQSNEALHKRLKEIDPGMAEIIHPNNRRKVIRSLQVHHQTGETHSSHLRRQRSLPGGCDIGGPLRFTNAIILWLQCESSVLNGRLDSRVDAMLSQGLVKELLNFRKKYLENKDSNESNSDFTKGILQSIGFKEFNAYLTCDETVRDTEEGIKLLENGVELLKVATRQYAKRQNRWIRNRLLNNTGRQVPPIYSLNATDLSTWQQEVHEKAMHLVECHLSGRKPDYDAMSPTGKRSSVDKCHPCSVCNQIMLGQRQWEEHVNGNRHRSNVNKKARAEEVNRLMESELREFKGEENSKERIG